MDDDQGLSDEDIDRIVEAELAQTPEGGREVCPECGSADTHYELGGETGKKYHCKDCGYIGALILQTTEEPTGRESDEGEP